MIDVETRERVEVNEDEGAAPYLMIPLEQLPDVERVLHNNGIPHYVAEEAVELEGKPPIVIINFEYEPGAAVIQAALDAG